MGYRDYVKNTSGSNGGQMLIRVGDPVGQTGVINANEVQFFVRSGLSATWVGSPGFGTRAYVNGGWQNLNRVANHSNSTSWIWLGNVIVTTNQTVTLHIDASGTQGFGGPDDFAVAISRASVPAAPTPIGIDEVGHQSLRYRFSGNSNGGAPILEWQVGYGYSSSNVQWSKPSGGTITITPFYPGATVYVWSRGRNIAGWGPWSTRLSTTLRRGCRIRINNAWSHSVPYIKYNGAWKPAEPYIKKGKVPGVSDGTWALASYTG